MLLLKTIIRRFASFVCFLLLLPLFVIYKMQSLLTKNERFYSDCTQLLSLFPGIFGEFMRKEFYKFTLNKCSDVCCIGFGSIIAHPQAEIGKNVYIGVNCMIGTVTIEDDVLIGSNVDILDGKKQHSFDSLEIPIWQQPRNIQRIIIGRDSWVGNSTVIMANVGKSCVIGAGSVVVNDIEEFSIAVGNPAKVVKKRK